MTGQQRLGLGLAAIGRPAYITTGRDASLGGHRTPDAMRARTWELLDAAYAAGIGYVDAARSYGLAEEFLAGWLAAHPEAADVVVGSKWGYRYVGDWRLDTDVHEIKDHSVAAFTTQSAESLELLGDRLAIYHVHSVTPDSAALDDTALHRAMAGLQDRGIRVGISTSGPAQSDVVRRAMTVKANGSALFTSFQSTWNLLEPSAGSALAEAAASGATVIVKEAVANGRLAPGGTDRSAGVRRAAELATHAGISLDQLVLAHALAQPWAHRVLCGATDVAKLTSNVAATRVTLTDDILGELDTLAESPLAYWTKRSRRAWT